jgi:DNA-damage-inducible protein D
MRFFSGQAIFVALRISPMNDNLPGPATFPFEEQAKENGVRYWDAWTLMKSLGYESYASFKNVILKAISSCARLGIETHEAFTPETVMEEGKPRSTYRLTRFACFLITLHSDDGKPQVSAAKVYFATIAEAIIQSGIQLNDLERLEVRSDLTEGENSMESAAKSAGVENFAYFKSAGFRGMYNMNLSELKVRKGVSANAKLYDLMGKTELAANWFRVTQTAERIRSHNIKGQRSLENAAHQVGASVRNEMIRNSMVKPENLPLEEDLKLVRGRIANAKKGMGKLDAASKRELPPSAERSA